MGILEFLATNVLAILVTGGAGLTTTFGFIKWYLARRDRNAQAAQKAAGRIPDMFDAFNRLYNLLRVPIENYGAARVVLKKASNGGGIPRVGSPFFVSIVAEELHYRATPMRAHWDRRHVDDYYVRILSDLITEQRTQVATHEIPVASPLRDTYMIGAVMCSDMWLVVQTDKEMYYIAVHFLKAIPDSPAYRESMRQIVSEAREILESEIAAVGES